MMQKRWTFFLLLIIPFFTQGQSSSQVIEGKVVELDKDGNTAPLIGVNIFWEETTNGTVSNEQGLFSLTTSTETKNLVFSYIGYKNEVVEINNNDFLKVTLSTSLELGEINVVKRQKTSNISLINTIKVENVGEGELLKAACCNLSESFETNPSIDVSFTDAVTGTKQIRMLGLAGPNVQLSQENMPGLRGLASIYGLSFIPGTWIESIQLNKGTGTVVNGYESIAGQINVELRKPEEADRLYLNLFANTESRLEANLNLAHKFKDSKWSTAVLMHAKDNSEEFDHNKDGFVDMPTGNTATLLNRWRYKGEELRFQAGIKGTSMKNEGGQLDFRPEDALTTNSYGMKLDIERLEAWAKIGRLFAETPWKSFGFQFSGATHKQKSYFGLNNYDAKQNSFYANFIYQSIIGNSSHQFKTGASFQYDRFEEQLNNLEFNRTESVPGVYFEYSFLPTDNFSLVAGVRADHHNLFGTFITPRVHMRYAMAELSVLRFSFGRGQRTASIIAENSGILASSRQLIFQGNREGKPYGFNPEVAWNMGLNFTQKFLLDYREGTFSVDFYRTNFDQQVVMDLEQSPQQALFYELDGKSFSNSFQAQLDYELFKRLDTRIAYRWYNVKTTYQVELMKKPLQASHRAFLNLAYHTRNEWKFDYTINWQGKKRIPTTASNPVKYQRADYSPDFVLMNTQVSKTWGERFEIYAGIENLLDYKQKNPIIASDDPFSSYFDSSLVWGPIFGRKTYFGIRFKIL